MNRSIAMLAGAAALWVVAVAATPSPAPHAPASPSPAPAASPAGGGTVLLFAGMQLHTKMVDATLKTGDFSAPGHVTIARPTGDINADRASGNYDKQVLTLYGHVVANDNGGGLGKLASAGSTTSRGPATLTADQLFIDLQRKTYTATGNVHYVQADSVMDSDIATLSDVTHILDLRGNVRIKQGNRNMRAGHVIYNTVTGLVHAEDNVTIVLPAAAAPHLATPKPIVIKNPPIGH